MNPLEITLLILLVTIIVFVSGKVPFSVRVLPTWHGTTS